MVPGKEDPDIVTINMKAPKGYGPGWGPAPNHTRPLAVTGSICLDFASSASFTSLDTRPALTLAPANTWHQSVGYAMWEQAKARAAETGSTVLWCDGGVGGLSGVARGDYSEIVQRGLGSWYKVVPWQYPFPEHRTIYAATGQYGPFAVVWAVLGLGYGTSGAILLSMRGRDSVRGLLERVRTRVGTLRAARRPEPPLVDL